MHRVLLVVMTTLSLVIASAAVSTAQKPKPKPAPAPGAVTIKAAQDPVVFGSVMTFTGRVDGAKDGLLVTLQSSTSSTGTFAAIATATTANGGKYSVGTRPERNMYYRVVAATTPATQSGPLLARVRTLVGVRTSDTTPRRGSRVRFSGTVRPRHDGRTVYVQRRSSSGSWFTVGRSTLQASSATRSRYSKRVRIRSSGVYRTKVNGHADHATGYSRAVTLAVH